MEKINNITINQIDNISKSVMSILCECVDVCDRDLIDYSNYSNDVKFDFTQSEDECDNIFIDISYTSDDTINFFSVQLNSKCDIECLKKVYQFDLNNLCDYDFNKDYFFVVNNNSKTVLVNSLIDINNELQLFLKEFENN